MASARSVQPRRGRPGLQRRQPSFDRAYEAVEIFRSQLIGIDFGDPANVECQPYCQPRGTAAELIVQQVFRLLVVAALALVATEAFAHDLPCDAFRRNLFGSWSARRLATIQGPQGPITLRRGRTFRPGEYYKGLDFAALLERRCRGGPLNNSSFPKVFPQNVPCGAFRRNPFGSWSARRAVTVHGPAGPISVRRGRTFKPGEYYNRLDLAVLLERNCR